VTLNLSPPGEIYSSSIVPNATAALEKVPRKLPVSAPKKFKTLRRELFFGF
jgi:hypothetical protein